MNENNNVATNDENTPEENSNLNWPTFDYNEQNWPANRLYVSELPENPTPGIQKKDSQEELILKFDWYFSTSENEIQSREFSVPKSGKKFFLKALISQWMENGKNVQVLLLTSDDDCTKTVNVEYTAKLRSPNWKCVEELRGCQEFNFACKGIDLFSVKGTPVDVWPADGTEVIAEMDLIPKVYAVKGTLKCLKERVQNWKLVSRPKSKDSDLLKIHV